MAADGDALLAGTIANPRLWRLGMLLDMEARTLTVAATSTVGEEAVLCRTIRLAEGVTPLRALEDAVYDNPMLLADFDRTTVLLRTPRFAIVPAEIASDTDALADVASLLHTSPDDADERWIAARADGTGAVVAAACDPAIAAFLSRTFADARVRHALVSEISYFAAKAPHSGNAPKLFAVAGAGCADFMAFDGAHFLGATSYACADAADMAYYAAALAQTCGIASPHLRFYVAGEPAGRDALVAALRGFAPCVMPWVFPSGMLADGVDLSTPFPLVILPLCE